ncbi:preprotein translocase subunit SecE [Catellicoccus marimammalium]|uniref:Protein translocase subunit SecE n=1 Tax=Catellicoccus marimammalium M35/04/3 TaxID=1234409 RepID=K8ZQU3_9ENTE|nr:hypothetical protein C683_0200 [Catellicoccus marimammalium M35/04/3]
MKKIGQFFKSVAHEMRLVTWPTGKQWRKDVLTVIEMTLIFAIFFAVADWGLTHLMSFILK